MSMGGLTGSGAAKRRRVANSSVSPARGALGENGDSPRGPRRKGREEEVHEVNDAYGDWSDLQESCKIQGRRGWRQPRSVTSVPLLGVPRLQGDDGVDGRTVHFLLKLSLALRKKEEAKEREEKEKAQKVAKMMADFFSSHGHRRPRRAVPTRRMRTSGGGRRKRGGSKNARSLGDDFFLSQRGAWFDSGYMRLLDVFLTFSSCMRCSRNSHLEIWIFFLRAPCI